MRRTLDSATTDPMRHFPLRTSGPVKGPFKHLVGRLPLLAGLSLAGGLLCLPLQAQDSVRETITPDGLRIWSFPDDGGDRFLIMVLVGSGSRQEQPANSGVAHLLEHMLLGSTRSWSKAESSEVIERAGGGFNGYTEHDLTTYYIRCNSSSWSVAVDWLAQHLVNPYLDQRDLEDERRIVFEELDSRQPHAGVATFEGYYYPGHPLGENIGGNSSGIERLEREDLARFHARHYRARNMAVGFAGRVPRKACVEKISRAFAGLDAQGGIAEIQQVHPRSGETILPGRDFGAAWMQLGYHLPAGNAQEKAVQLLISSYLSLRSFQVVREDRQLSYAPDFELYHHADTARLSFSVKVSERENLQEVVSIIDGLLLELDQPQPAVLRSAQRRVRATLQVNDTNELGAAMEIAWFMRRGGESPVDLQAALQTTGAQEVRNYATQHITLQNRFVLANAPLSRPSMWIVLIGLAFTVVVFDGIRGFVWWAALRQRFARSKAPQPKPRKRSVAPKDTIVPISGNELEKHIHEFFDDDDDDLGSSAKF